MARVSATVALPLEPGGGSLPDGSHLTWLNAPSGKKQDRLPVRAAEHKRSCPAAAGRRKYPDLTDHHPAGPPAAPEGAVRDTYLTGGARRRPRSARTKRPSPAPEPRCGPVLRSGSPPLVILEAWAWLAGTQLVRASAAAARRTGAAGPAPCGAEDSAPVTADKESFTPVSRHAIRSMTSPRSPPRRRWKQSPPRPRPRPAPPAQPERPRAAALKRARKTPPEIPARHRHQADRHRKPQITAFAPGFS